MTDTLDHLAKRCRRTFATTETLGHQRAESRWFTPQFVAKRPDEVDRLVDMLAKTSPQGYAANCADVRDADFRGQIASTGLRVLVVCGNCEHVTTVVDGEFLVNALEGAHLIEFPAAHLSNVEAAFRCRGLGFSNIEVARVIASFQRLPNRRPLI